MIRVVVVEADGRTVDVRTDEPYNPDALDDMVRRVILLTLAVEAK